MYDLQDVVQNEKEKELDNSVSLSLFFWGVGMTIVSLQNLINLGTSMQLRKGNFGYPMHLKF